MKGNPEDRYTLLDPPSNPPTQITKKFGAFPIPNPSMGAIEAVLQNVPRHQRAFRWWLHSARGNEKVTNVFACMRCENGWKLIILGEKFWKMCYFEMVDVFEGKLFDHWKIPRSIPKKVSEKSPLPPNTILQYLEGSLSEPVEDPAAWGRGNKCNCARGREGWVEERPFQPQPWEKVLNIWRQYNWTWKCEVKCRSPTVLVSDAMCVTKKLRVAFEYLPT